MPIGGVGFPDSVAGTGFRAADIRPAAEPAVRPDAAQDAASGEYRAKAAAAAEKFEAHFIAQVLKQMRRSARDINDDDERSFAARANEDMLEVADTFVADALARQRAFGIADLILRQLVPEAGGLKPPAASVASFHEGPRNE